MNADVFLDTNIFLYSTDNSADAADKREIARKVLQTEFWGWSVQVAAEFFVNATSQKRPFRMAIPLATALVETWLNFPAADLTPEIVRDAMSLHQRYQTSYWDSAILATARQLGCHTVLSEDLNHSQSFDGIQVINPFLKTPSKPS